MSSWFGKASFDLREYHATLGWGSAELPGFELEQPPLLRLQPVYADAKMGADKPPDSGLGISQIAAWALGAIIFLAALGALYEVGKGIQHPLLLPAAAVVLSVLYAFVRYSPKWAGPILAVRRERARRLAEYPLRVEEVRTLKGDKHQLEERVKALEQGIGRTWRAGLREGQAEFIGAYLSREVKAMPSVVAVAMSGQKIQLTCQINGNQKIEVSTRFVLVAISGQLLGALTVTSVSANGQTLTAEVIQETNVAFWDHIRNRADHDFTAPQNVSIQRYLAPTVPQEAPVTGQGDQRIEEGTK
jgi:hypothetical protein